jgi:TRAP-type C4-dicarboxylate transport system permease small subunit
VWLTWLLMQRIGSQRMAIVELPIGLVFGAMLAGFALMLARSLQVALRHLRGDYGEQRP